MPAETVYDAAPGARIAARVWTMWWLLLLRGIAGVLFGLFALFWPGAALYGLILVWGVYALADGLVALCDGVVQGGEGRWWLVVAGLVGVGVGAIALLWPGPAAASLLMIIGGWAIITGLLQIVGALEVRREIDGEWLLILGGAVSVLFGLIFMFQPLAGAISLMWMVGLYVLVTGLLLIGVAFRLKALRPPE